MQPSCYFSNDAINTSFVIYDSMIQFKGSIQTLTKHSLNRYVSHFYYFFTDQMYLKCRG